MVNKIGMAHSGIRAFSKMATYVVSGWRYESPLDPTHLIQVSPDDVNYASKKKPEMPVPIQSCVKSGSWDKNRISIHNDVVFTSVKMRYVDGEDWKDTPYHNFMKDMLDSGGEWRKYKNKEHIENRYKKLDKLYNNIRGNGYSSQKELLSDGSTKVQFTKKRDGDRYLPPEFNEVSIDIARDGTLYWATGMHRLCIAKILDIRQIPVRVRVRHEKWQEFREELFLRNEQRTHPDLRFEN